MLEWDEDKRRRNLAKHGVDFAAAADIDWRTALEFPDTAEDYGEQRLIALGFIGIRLYVCVYTRRETNRRIISLRKANKREERFYVEETGAAD